MSITPGGPGSSTYESQVPQQTASSRLAYVKAVLAAGGWPDTASNEQFLLNMAQEEHGVKDTAHASAAYNLFNSSRRVPGSTTFNYDKNGNPLVQNYPDFATGVAAAVATLKQGYYKNIQAGLAAGDANSWDASGRFASDLKTWSGGAYTTVANINGGDGPLTGRGQSVSNTGGDPSGAAGTDLTGDINGFLQSQAPALAAAMNDPEVKNLLTLWGQDKLSTPDFQVRLEATNWWRTTPQAQRQLLISQATDPATAAQNLNNQVSSVQTLADKLGIGLTPQQAGQIASQSIAGQWSSTQIQQQVATFAKYQGDITYKGEAAVDVNALRGVYKAMALPTTDATLNGQLQDVLSGRLTIQDIQDQVAQQAAAFYSANPQLAEFLKSGQGTVSSWAQPLISHAANLLGMDPNSIDLTNPQWTFLLKPQTNPTTGQSVGMAQTLDSVEQQVKTDPVFGYSKTANGVAEYQNLVDKLQSTFTGGGV